MIKNIHLTDPYSDWLFETSHVVIYTYVLTHFVSLKATQLALHGDFDTQRFSKAAASVRTTFAGSASQLKIVLQMQERPYWHLAFIYNLIDIRNTFTMGIHGDPFPVPGGQEV